MVEYTTAGFLSVVRNTTGGTLAVWIPKLKLMVVVAASHVRYLLSVPVDAQIDMVNLGGSTGTMHDALGAGIVMGGYGGL
jgi:hypothetical protein